MGLEAARRHAHKRIVRINRSILRGVNFHIWCCRRDLLLSVKPSSFNDSMAARDRQRRERKMPAKFRENVAPLMTASDDGEMRSSFLCGV